MITIKLTKEQYSELLSMFECHLRELWLNEDYIRDKKIYDAIVDQVEKKESV